jgi:hypothetical protein
MKNQNIKRESIKNRLRHKTCDNCKYLLTYKKTRSKVFNDTTNNDLWLLEKRHCALKTKVVNHESKISKESIIPKERTCKYFWDNK